MKNAKLWKRILHGGVLFAPKDIPLQKAIISAPIILSHRLCSEGEYYFDWSRFKSLSIPFTGSGGFWIEVEVENGENIGALVVAIRRDGHFDLLIMAVGYADGNPCLSFMTTIRINSDGSLDVTDEQALKMGRPRWFVEADCDPSLADDQKRGTVNTYLDEILYVLQMLACKNVSLSARDNDPKQVRIATKRHGPSNTGYRYHVLTVRPPGAKSDSPGVEIGTMPRHVCRGHFSEYGPEFGKGLLFGRLSGRFFIPPHVRGDKKNGIVEKDYEIPAALTA